MEELIRLIKELMKLLQTEEDYDYDYEMVEYEMNEIKEELGSWYIADCKLYVGA
jgi:hypothetical protein